MNPSKEADTDRPASKAAVVARLRERLQHDSFPRLTVLMIVLLAGGCAFLFSAITLTPAFIPWPCATGWLP